MNTGVFSVIEAVILRPLSYPDANRLIWLTTLYGNLTEIIDRSERLD